MFVFKTNIIRHGHPKPRGSMKTNMAEIERDGQRKWGSIRGREENERERRKKKIYII